MALKRVTILEASDYIICFNFYGVYIRGPRSLSQRQRWSCPGCPILSMELHSDLNCAWAVLKGPGGRPPPIQKSGPHVPPNEVSDCCNTGRPMPICARHSLAFVTLTFSDADNEFYFILMISAHRTVHGRFWRDQAAAPPPYKSLW